MTRIVCWNVKGMNTQIVPTPLCGVALQYMIDVLSPLNPDIVCLQEINMFSGYGPCAPANQAKTIGDAIGLRAYYGLATTFQQGSFGNAILTNMPIKEHRLFRLHHVERDWEIGAVAPQRSCCILEIGGATPFTVLSTHMNGGDSVEANDERILQLDQIASFFTKGFVCGDFNHTADRASAIYALGTLGWTNAGVDSAVTTTVNPNDHRDWIYNDGQ